MPSIFSKIIAGEVPCHKLAEDEHSFAFLDINPNAPGHALVVPKREVDRYFDLEDQELARLNQFAKKVARALEAVVPCQRVGVAIVGLEVPHAHVHLIPLRAMDDFHFNKPKPKPTHEELAQLADKIRQQFDRMT